MISALFTRYRRCWTVCGGVIAVLAIFASGCKNEPVDRQTNTSVQPQPVPSPQIQPHQPPTAPEVEPARPETNTGASHGTLFVDMYANTPGTRIGILHTANMMGELYDCGCNVNPLGGLARRVQWVRDRATKWHTTLVLDAGDALAERSTLGEEDDSTVILDRAKVILDAYKALGVEAINVGDRDLALGIPALVELAQSFTFPLVSANIVRADDQQPVFAPHTIVEKSGAKIGIFGLVTRNYDKRSEHETAYGIQIADPVVSAERQVQTLRASGAQVIICLAQMTPEEELDLADKVKGITAILGSDTPGAQHVPDIRHGTYIVDGSEKGKHISALTLILRDGEKPYEFVDPSRRKSLTDKLNTLTQRIQERGEVIAKIGDDPARSANLKWAQQTLAQARAEHQTVQMELEELPEIDPSRSSLLVYDFVEIPSHLPEDPTIVASIAALAAKHPRLQKPKSDTADSL